MDIVVNNARHFPATLAWLPSLETRCAPNLSSHTKESTKGDLVLLIGDLGDGWGLPFVP